jgi:glucose-6-phosphate isomerase
VELDDRVALQLAALAQHDAIRRIWQKDFTVWRDDPTEITDRLGWLTVHEVMHERLSELRRFATTCAAEGLTHALLAGMGGSSLAPEVLRETFGVSPGMLDLVVLDTTHPDQVLAVERSLPLDHTLFVIASKSGTTTETLSHLAYFWERVPDGSRFVAITDPGTPLGKLASERGFRRTFLNPGDIGGRYSALSYFGLVPGALIGADLDGVLQAAMEMARACGVEASPAENPGAWLGVTIGEAALAGRDKLTLVLDEPIRSFGYWVEQLVAESTGKDGKGIVPVEGEDIGDPGVYGSDRLFAGIGSDDVEKALAPIHDSAQLGVHLEMQEAIDVGREFFRWEFATAVAGAVLGINPFDQPNVQEAKDTTKALLGRDDLPDPGLDDLGSFLDQVRVGDYLAIQAYLPRNQDTERRLHHARMRLRDRLRVATSVGFGPRYLHSTGQLHKGGPNTGVFVQVVEPPAEDAPIPGQPYSFGTLIAAQARGDLQSLRARGRRVARVRLEDLEASAKP